jgi:predicted dehydrogenase
MFQESKYGRDAFCWPRRDFLKTGFSAGLAAGCGYAFGGQSKKGDKPRMAFIGAGWQARYLLHVFLGQDVIFKGICDCDRIRREHLAKIVDDYYLSRNLPYSKAVRWSDYNDVIADPEIDMVCIATPDHWHAYLTVAAMKAGKDVYCEQPLTYSTEEAKLVMAAEAKYGRILQTGSMQRSAVEFRTACEVVRNGGIGKVRFVDCNFGGPSCPHRDYENPANAAAEGAPNPDIDFDMWCGGAPLVKYSDCLAPRGVHKMFPSFWRNHDYFALGMCGDWGAHHLDIAQWGLDLDSSGPVKIVRSDEPPSSHPFHGGRRQSGLQMVFADGCVLRHNPFSNWGTVFYGTDGIVAVNRGRIGVWSGKGCTPDAKIRGGIVDGTFDAMKAVAFWSPVRKRKDSPNAVPPCSSRSMLDACNKAIKEFDLKNAKTKLYRSFNHIADFVARCKDRKTACTPASVGGRAAILCQLCNISYVRDAGFDWDPAKNEFANGTGDASWLARSSYRKGLKVTL